MLRHFAAAVTRTPVARSGLCAAVGVGTLGYSGVSLCTPRLKSAATVIDPQEAKFTAPAVEKAPSIPLEKKCLAELIGTAIIVSGGCGIVAASKYAGAQVGVFGVASIWGVSVALAVYATRAVSGAHLNPAVTCALVATGATPVDEAGPYIAAQCIGATIAGAVNYVVFSAGIAASEAAGSIVRGTAASTASFAGAFGMVPNTALLGVAGAFIAEVWMTSILMFMISAIGDANAGSVPAGAQPVLVGSTVAMLICTFGPVTGAGMNPARDLGPRLVTLCTGWGSVALTSWWVYTLGPVVGAILGAYAYQELFAVETKKLRNV